MDVWGAIKVLAYRYYVVIPLCAITMLCGYLFANKVQAEYHASAEVVLIGPTGPSDSKNPPPANPYVSLGTSTTASVIQLHMYDIPSQQQVLAAGNSTDYTLSVASRSPIIDVTSVAATPQIAVSTANQLVGMIQADLANIQKSYTTNKLYQITSIVAASSTVATEDHSSRTKALAIALGVAFVVSALLTLLFDSIMVSRKRRASEARWVDDSLARDTEPAQRTPVVRS